MNFRVAPVPVVSICVAKNRFRLGAESPSFLLPSDPIQYMRFPSRADASISTSLSLVLSLFLASSCTEKLQPFSVGSMFGGSQLALIGSSPAARLYSRMAFISSTRKSLRLLSIEIPVEASIAPRKLDRTLTTAIRSLKSPFATSGESSQASRYSRPGIVSVISTWSFPSLGSLLARLLDHLYVQPGLAVA